MNRRGELERAIKRARLPKSTHDALLALLSKSGNESGEVTAKWAVSAARLAADQKVNDRTMRRGLDDAERHGWWRPGPCDSNGEVPKRWQLTGVLVVGQDCDCSGVAAARCEVCGKPLTGKRLNARTCGTRCRKAASRADSKRDIERTETVTDVDSKRDMSRHVGVTVTAPRCDKSQVAPRIRQETATRKKEEEAFRDEEPAEPERDPRWPGWPAGTIGAYENRDQPWQANR